MHLSKKRKYMIPSGRVMDVIPSLEPPSQPSSMKSESKDDPELSKIITGRIDLNDPAAVGEAAQRYKQYMDARKAKREAYKLKVVQLKDLIKKEGVSLKSLQPYKRKYPLRRRTPYKRRGKYPFYRRRWYRRPYYRRPYYVRGGGGGGAASASASAS